MKKIARYILNTKTQKSRFFNFSKISEILKIDFIYISLFQLNLMSAQNYPNTVTLSLASGYTFQIFHSKCSFLKSEEVAISLESSGFRAIAYTTFICILNYSCNCLSQEYNFLTTNS